MKTELTLKEKQDLNPAELLTKAYGIKEIQTEQELALVTNVGSGLNKALKEIEEKRLKFTKPLLDTKKNLDAEFKKLSQPISAEVTRLRGVVSDYNRKLEEQRQKELQERKEAEEKRLAEEMKNASKEEIQEKAQEIAEVEVEEVAKTVETQAGSQATSVKRWTFEIVDFSKVPDQYKEIVSAKVNRAIRDGVREIDGLKIYQETTTSFR